MPVAQAMDDAVRLHRAGRLAEAERFYRQVLDAQPDHADTLHLLGMVAVQAGKPDAAIPLIERAIGIDPANPVFQQSLASAYVGLGNVQSDSGAREQALQSYRQAAKLTPQDPAVHFNIASALHEQGKLGEAEQLYRHVHQLEPQDAEVCYRLGAVLIALARPAEALEMLQQAVNLKPDYAEAMSDKGLALKLLRRLDEAAAACRRAVEINPALAPAHHTLGVVLEEAGQFDEAGLSYARAIDLAPRWADYYFALGNIFQKKDRHAQAIDLYQQALKLRPNYVEAMTNLAMCLQSIERFDEAERLFRGALALQPDLARIHANLGALLNDMGRIDESIACARRAAELEPENQDFHSTFLMWLDLSEHSSAAEQSEERRRWNERHARRYRGDILPWSNLRDTGRKLRIGYVSADLRAHSAAFIFAPVVCGHDKAHFEVVCYSDVKKEDEVTRRIRAAADLWRSTSLMTDQELAAQVRADGIDVLVDLAGHSSGHRLLVFARKPAPVQVTAWGYATGTGMEVMDYFLADPVLVPEPERRHFAEQVIDLPCCVCFEAQPDIPDVAPLPAARGRPLTFGCINRVEKISARSLSAWSKILASLPRSRLLMKDRRLDGARARELLLARMAAAGIDGERVILRGKSTHAEHLGSYNDVDIALDPYPHGGGTSTLESLWMGVPVLNLAGPTIPSRVSAAILTAGGLHDWIAYSDQEYVDKAIKAAGELERLSELRARLRQQMIASPVGDVRSYTRAVEAVYRQAWQRWCEAK